MPQVAAYAGTVVSSGGSVPWMSPESAQGPPEGPSGAYAFQSTTNSAADAFLLATDYDFNLPAGSNVTQVTVNVYTYNNIDLGASGGIISLYALGGPFGNNVYDDNTYTPDQPVSGEGYQQFGAASGTWGATVTDAETNLTDFGVRIRASRVATNFVDSIEIILDYESVTPTPTVTSSPTVTPTQTTTPTPTITPTMTVTPTPGPAPSTNNIVIWFNQFFVRRNRVKNPDDR